MTFSEWRRERYREYLFWNLGWAIFLEDRYSYSGTYRKQARG